MKKKVPMIPFELATGKIEYPLLDDMVFHIAMQESNLALKGLVCALQGLDPRTVASVVLTNQVDYNVAGKEIVLDVRVTLDNKEIMNIELQVRRDEEWINRSLLYLCRAFDSIGKSEDYDLLKPTTHVGIMDYDLFPDEPEFYAKYRLMNMKSHRIYTPNFNLNVLSLKQADKATQEDKNAGLVYWAKLFKATTWDEIRQYTKAGRDLLEVAEVMYEVNADDRKRAILDARKKYREIVTTQKNRIARQAQEIENLHRRIEELEAALAAKEKSVAE